MFRVEITFPLQDKNLNDVDMSSIALVIKKIGKKCKGYRLTRTIGFWKPPKGKPYKGPVWLLVTDTSFDNAVWCRRKKKKWGKKLIQKQRYLSIQVIDWI